MFNTPGDLRLFPTIQCHRLTIEANCMHVLEDTISWCSGYNLLGFVDGSTPCPLRTLLFLLLNHKLPCISTMHVHHYYCICYVCNYDANDW